MNNDDHRTVSCFVPLAFGLVGLLLQATYSIQRAHLLQSSPASEGAQARLHLIGALAALTGLAGFGLYFILRKTGPNSKILLAGLLTNLVASVWGFVLNFR
jgi:hypothetical protein